MLPGGTAFPPTVPVTQTYGCACGTAYTARPQAFQGAGVNTATEAFSEAFTSAQLPGPGAAFDFGLALTSADTASGPLGPGWTDSCQAGLSFDLSGIRRSPPGTASRSGSRTPAAPTRPARRVRVTVGGVGRVPGDRAGRYQAGLRGRRPADLGDRPVRQRRHPGLHRRAARLGDRHRRTFGQLRLRLGRAADVADLPDGASVAYGYDGGLLTSVTEPGGVTTRFGYDSGRLATITDPDQHIVLTNTYDPATGRITSQKDGDGNITTCAWDPAGQTETITAPGGGVWTDVYADDVLVGRSTRSPGPPTTATTPTWTSPRSPTRSATGPR